MFLAPFPRALFFDALVSSLSDISSSFCPSRVADERELVSIDVPAADSLLDPNFGLHLDFPFSGGATSGIVRLRDGGGGSKETEETD